MNETKSEYKVLMEFFGAAHSVAPNELKRLVRALEKHNRSKLLPGRKKQWTIEWQHALVVFVERRIRKRALTAWISDAPINRPTISRWREEALREALRRKFPFHTRSTLQAARKQYFDAKRRLKSVPRAGLGLAWIEMALSLENAYQLFSRLGDAGVALLKQEYIGMPEWVWERLARGELLIPDVP